MRVLYARGEHTGRGHQRAFCKPGQRASGSEFRTAPLWGLGQRLFFLHDGRTNDLVEAIDAHKSAGSEANGVVGTFDSLNDRQKQAILNYLRSL